MSRELVTRHCPKAFVNLGNPRSDIGAANPRRIDTAGDPRIIQFGLRMTF